MLALAADAGTAVAAATAKHPAASSSIAPAARSLRGMARPVMFMCFLASSVRGEVLVGAGGVLAWPLVELLAGVADGVVDVQAQAAVGVLELPGAVGLL